MRMSLQETAPDAYRGFKQADAAIRRSPLDPVVRELVKIRASQINGCTFCVDLHVREARSLGVAEDRMHQLCVWDKSLLFSDKERVALAYTEAATRREPVTDELWNEVCKQFPDEAERGNLVAQVALINALNLIGVPLRMRPPAS
jgi:AhpD family alkylhydroperoxidase